MFTYTSFTLKPDSTAKFLPFDPCPCRSLIAFSITQTHTLYTHTFSLVKLISAAASVGVGFPGVIQ